MPLPRRPRPVRSRDCGPGRGGSGLARAAAGLQPAGARSRRSRRPGDRYAAQRCRGRASHCARGRRHLLERHLTVGGSRQGACPTPGHARRMQRVVGKGDHRGRARGQPATCPRSAQGTGRACAAPPAAPPGRGAATTTPARRRPSQARGGGSDAATPSVPSLGQFGRLPRIGRGHCVRRSQPARHSDQLRRRDRGRPPSTPPRVRPATARPRSRADTAATTAARSATCASRRSSDSSRIGVLLPCPRRS